MVYITKDTARRHFPDRTHGVITTISGNGRSGHAATTKDLIGRNSRYEARRSHLHFFLIAMAD